MSEEYKIEKGIPLPKPGKDVNTIVTLIKSMKVGDSFRANHPPTTFYSAAKYNGVKVAVRKLQEGGFRVWRVK